MAVDIGAGNGIASFALARDDWQTVAIELHSSDLVVAGAIRQLARETGWKG
jgi:tRNA1(Val) A37 N6-methylase TrmN6